MKSADQTTSRPLTPEQMRGARMILGWSRDRLAVQSETTVGFITKFEDTGQIGTFLWHPIEFDALHALRTALEAAGVEFVEENRGGPGVRLRRATPVD